MSGKRRSESGRERDSKRPRKRRSRWGDSTSTTPAASANAEPSQKSIAFVEARLQEEIRLRTQSLQQHIETARLMAASARLPIPLMLDDQGRQVDSQGNVVDLKRDVSTLMANRAPEPKPQMPEAPVEEDKEPDQRFVDPRMPQSRVERRPRSFKFVVPGAHTRKAQNLRLRQLKEDMRQEKRAAVDNTSGSVADQRIMALSVPEQVEVVSVPDVEWWDQDLLGASGYSGGLMPSVITNLVQHPVPLRSRSERGAPGPMAVMLTEQEKKKMKRLRKMEKQKEKQDKIRLGLEPPPEPRITLKNMTRVLSQEAIEDPTAVEVKARAQMEKRQLSHNLHNESRRLTPREKAQKKRLKLKEDTTLEVQVALFRVDQIEHAQNRYKVFVTAEQLNLSGLLLLHTDCNVVVVEGGPKSIRKYIRLMLKRIKWQNDDVYAEKEDDDDDDDDDDERVPLRRNACHLIWEGTVAKRSFSNFRVVDCATESMARKHFAEKGLASYWDMCRNYQAEDEIH